MEWKLEDVRKKQYSNLLQNTQQLEQTIGSTYYRITKLTDMRKELDATLKTWWDEVIAEMKLDANRDYMITADGVIQDVSKDKPSVPAKPADVEVAKPKTIDDLK